jgi:hypothetical protein
MLKDTIYIYQFQDPVEKEPSNFDWSLDLDEVDLNSMLLGYKETINNKENEGTTNFIFNSDGSGNTGRT